MGIATVIASGFVILVTFVVGTQAQAIAVPVVDFVVNISVQPLSIPIVSQLLVWGQLCAAAIVIVIRVVKGWYSGMLGGGDRQPGSFYEWVLKTVVSVAGVALMPVFCNMVITLGTMMLTDIQNVASGIELLTPPTIEETWYEALEGETIATLGGILASAIMVLFLLGACIKVAYELLKREMVMLIVSVVSPWVSIKSALDQPDDYFDLLTCLLGLCITQWVQFVFLLIAVSMFNDAVGAAAATAGNWFEIAFLSEESIWATLWVAAALAAAMAAPNVIERWSFSTGRGGVGALVVGTLMRGGMRGVTSLPRLLRGAR